MRPVLLAFLSGAAAACTVGVLSLLVMLRRRPATLVPVDELRRRERARFASALVRGEAFACGCRQCVARRRARLGVQ